MSADIRCAAGYHNVASSITATLNGAAWHDKLGVQQDPQPFDTILAFATGIGDLSSMTPSQSGWAQVAHGTTASGTALTSDLPYWVFKKTVKAADIAAPMSWASTRPTGTPNFGITYVCFVGALSSVLMSAFFSGPPLHIETLTTTTGNTPVAGPWSLTADHALGVFFGALNPGTQSGVTAAVAPPSGMTELIDQCNTIGFTVQELAYQADMGASGTSVTKTATVTNASGGAALNGKRLGILVLVPSNSVPSVDAGADVSAQSGASVTLTGTVGDVFGTIDNFSWSQVSGPAATVSAIPGTFNQRVQLPNTVGDLLFALFAQDNDGGSNSDNVTIHSTNQPPLVDAGPDQSVMAGDLVSLAGTASDPEGTLLSWLWTKTSGPAIGSLLGSTTSSPTFIATTAGSVVMRATVTDANGGVTFDELTVTVAAPAAQWTPFSGQIAMPNDAFTVEYLLQVENSLAGGQHQARLAALAAGSTSVWSEGGRIAGTVMDLERTADGGATWTFVRGGRFVTPGAAERVVINDYEAPGLVGLLYRARASILVPVALTSSWVTSDSIVLPLVQWQLIHPDQPELNIHASITPDFNRKTANRQVVHDDIIGRADPVITEDVLSLQQGAISIWQKNAVEAARVDAIVTSGSKLLLKSNTGRTWWIRMGGEHNWDVKVSATNEFLAGLGDVWQYTNTFRETTAPAVL